MSSQAAGKPIITKNSSEFNRDEYASLATGDLVLLAMAVIQAEESPAAVEEIVSTCFRLFPHSFALKNYFYWPDSALVTRRLQDAKEKRLLKGSSADGYELKGKGKQTARQIAKALGVSLPVAPKPEAPAVVEAVEKKEEPATVKAEQKKAALKKKEPAKVKAKAKPVEKKSVKKTKPKKSVTQAVKSAKPAPKKKSPAAKKPSVVEVKAEKKVEVKPVVKVKAKSAPKAKPESPKKEAKSARKLKVQKEKNASATQLALMLAPPTAKKKEKAPAVKLRVKKEAKPVKVETPPAMAVSKEEKDKAAKVIKQLERSDAYQLYKRNGRRAQIGEFDFRNMLYATMESSAETLKRNLELFKRYADIHFRTDLIAFLEFCEEHFKSLLTVKTKQSFRKK